MNSWNVTPIRNIHLIFGLGNAKYPNTRHSIGAMVINTIARQSNVTFKSDKHSSVATIRNLKLIKPTHMNTSGKAVQYWINKEQAFLHQILVVVDDIYLSIGAIRYKEGGGAGGHNGMQNIIDIMQSKEFPRLRIGVGNNFIRGEQKKFVLTKFTDAEKPIINYAISQAVTMINKSYNNNELCEY
jgi:PTH1 family peptidyl-tRNA hydrolase